jgi:hypothetical protein
VTEDELIAIILNQSAPPEPSEFIIDGDFPDPNVAWTLGAGWTISGGQATNSGATGNLSQPMVQPLTLGNTYRVTFDFTDAPAEVFVRFSGAVAQNVSGITTTPFDETFVASSANTTFAIVNPDGEAFSVDNVSVVPA